MGSGTTVALANTMGMNAVDADIDLEQCRKAKILVI